MPAYKDKEKGTWYASFYYEDWTGKKVKKLKRGFSTKRDALEWERTFLQQQTADLEMTFENFVALYAADMKGRIKENTWGTKEHILYKKLVPYFGKRKMCDMILSILVDTFSSRILSPMLLFPANHSISVV